MNVCGRWLAAGVVASVLLAAGSARAQRGTADSGGMAGMAGMPGMSGMSSGDAGRMPPMPPGMPMMAGTNGGPAVRPWLPDVGLDVSALPMAQPGTTITLRDGDTLDLSAAPVRRTIRGRTLVMYAYNGQYPGPLIRVKQRSTITVRFHNKLVLPSAVHWHGIRLDYRSDGVPGVSQVATPAGGSFVYTVTFPDAGIYWYHPHVREDIEQNLGLFGNIRVDSPDPAYYSPVNLETPLMLGDILMDAGGLFPYGRDSADFTIMGRFGNVPLVNGDPKYALTVHKGDVVRFFLTDVASARSYNLVFGGAAVKVVAADVSRFEHEVMVPNVVIAPAERYVVEAYFDSAGTFAITNRVQALINMYGRYEPEVDTLGTITVLPERSATSYVREFQTLRTNAEVTKDIARFRAAFDKPPDKQLDLTVNIQGLPTPLVAFMTLDSLYFPPVEWNDGMPDMNWVSSARETRWLMRDAQTGKENMDIDWHFKQGDMVKIRIHNDPLSMHPMGHPIHFHGQRFLVLARNGVPNSDLAWKDTDLIPVGQTVDILLDASNPGKWMAHCHIAEHLEAGMHMMFTVDPAGAGAQGK